MSRRSFLLFFVVWLACTVGALLLQYSSAAQAREARAQRVRAIAEDAARNIPGEVHERIPLDPAQDIEADYIAVQSPLLKLREMNDLEAPMLTLRPVEPGQRLVYIVSTSKLNRIGAEAPFQEEAREALRAGVATTTPLYVEERGEPWLSAYAPIKDASGKTVALVRADQPMGALEASFSRSFWQRVLFAQLIFAGVYVVWVSGIAVRRYGVIGAYRQATQRIGVRLAFYFTILIGIGFSLLGYISYLNARHDLGQAISDKLRATAYLSALSIDGDQHAEAARNKRSVAAEKLSDALSQLQARTDLNTEFLIVRKDSELTVTATPMRDEGDFPFWRNEDMGFFTKVLQDGTVVVKSVYEQTLKEETGEKKAQFVSAYAPIINKQREIVAVLVADQDVSSILFEIENHSLWETAVAGTFVAILTAALAISLMRRSISAPLNALTASCQKIGQGNFDAPIHTGYRNELGVLAETLRHMIVELKAREQQLAREVQARSNYERFFPPQIVDQASQADLDLFRPGGGRELRVTVLFADIRNYTSLSREMPPREVAEMLNEYFSAVVAVVFQHKGTLEKYIGDALMAIWGAPIPAEDQEARAVAAAIDMQCAIRALNERWRRAGKSWNFEVGVGINTGVCFVGNIGTEEYIQYAAIGSTTNLSARLCSLAGPAEIVLSEESHRGLVRAGANIPLEQMPPFLAKGYDSQVTPFRVRYE